MRKCREWELLLTPLPRTQARWRLGEEPPGVTKMDVVPRLTGRRQRWPLMSVDPTDDQAKPTATWN